MTADSRRLDRDLHWDGCVNVRDLGGLPTASGRPTRRAAVVRSDNPARLSAEGWRALEDHGVRTVITLRTVGAVDDDPDPALVPASVTVRRVEIEDATDPEFRRRCIDTGWWTTPLEWAEMLDHWPQRCAAAVTAVARAEPGGVVVSCGIGRDRTGLVTFLLLALVGVPLDDLADDWQRSMDRLADDPLASDLPVLDVLEREQTTVRDAIESALALDVEARLTDAGLDPVDIRALRTRLVA